MKICRGVFDRCSTARITCVISQVVIVHHAGQMIETSSVGSLNHMVLFLSPLELHVSTHQIAKLTDSFARHLQPHHRLAPFGFEPSRLRRRLRHPRRS